MKRNISIFLAVIGVFIGRSVSRRGDAELQLIVISLALLCVLFFGLYVYKKYHNYLLPLGCLLLILWFPAFEVVHNTVKTPNAEFWAVLAHCSLCFLGLSDVCLPAHIRSHRKIYLIKNGNIGC